MDQNHACFAKVPRNVVHYDSMSTRGLKHKIITFANTCDALVRAFPVLINSGHLASVLRACIFVL